MHAHHPGTMSTPRVAREEHAAGVSLSPSEDPPSLSLICPIICQCTERANALHCGLVPCALPVVGAVALRC
jgi:hypothetical protein